MDHLVRWKALGYTPYTGIQQATSAKKGRDRDSNYGNIYCESLLADHLLDTLLGLLTLSVLISREECAGESIRILND